MKVLLCLLLVCAVACGYQASGQIRVAHIEKAGPDAAHPADTLTPTLLELNLCVDGSTAYPCPTPVTSDGTYIPAITLTYGQVLDGVVVYGPPTLNTGTITIYKDADAVCTLAIGVDTACPPGSTVFDVGNYTLTATLTFPAGSIYANSTAMPVTVSVEKDTTSIAISSSANPAALGSAVTFTATVTGGYPATPTGQVIFSVDGVAMPAVTLNGSGAATFSTSTLTLGQHTITASYAGATDFLAADDATFQQTIVPPATVTTIASSLNPSAVGDNVTFTSTVASASGFAITPTGAVTFKDGTATFVTVPIVAKGGVNVAQASTTALTEGSHSISAVYAGDAATSASVSPVLVQQVNYPLNSPPPGFRITLTPATISMGPGATADLTLTVTALSGYSGTVALSCSNLPKESACTFGEATVPVGGSTTLALSTMAPHDCGSDVPYGGFGARLGLPFKLGRRVRYATPVLAGVLLLLVPRRRRIASLLAVIVICGLFGVSGCGSACTDFGTSPGRYTFQVNGTSSAANPVTSGSASGAVSASTSVALQVKL